MNEINISRLVDTTRLRPFHLWLTSWCLLAMMADGFDLLNASIAGPALIKEWGVSRASLGPVFSASLVGFLVGAPFFGYLGDRFGRRVAIIFSLIVVGVTTLACAWATNLQELLWLRFGVVDAPWLQPCMAGRPMNDNFSAVSYRPKGLFPRVLARTGARQANASRV